MTLRCGTTRTPPSDGGNAKFDPLPAGTLNEIAVKEFHDALAKSSDVAVAVAAIKALTTVIRNSSAQTIMGLTKELQGAAQALQRWAMDSRPSHALVQPYIGCMCGRMWLSAYAWAVESTSRMHVCYLIHGPVSCMQTWVWVHGP